MPFAPEPSLDTLYVDHHGWLHRLLYHRVGCTETAADLAQDAFLRLLVRDEDVRRIREPRAYLRRIADGLLANHWRRRDIEQAYLDALRLQPEGVSPSPEQHHLVIETLLHIDKVLRGLPARVRRAFLLSRLDGVRYGEIAMTLGVSERMVKKYIAQAMLHCLRAAESLP